MAALFGYKSVPHPAFVAFLRALETEAWGAVSTSEWEGKKKKGGETSLLDAPLVVALKLDLRAAVLDLVAAIGATNLLDLDEDWDSTQRRLSFRLAEGRNARDRAVRAAADRLTAGLLLEGGVGQTQLDYEGQVDFGWMQQKLVESDARVGADVKLVKIQDVIHDIAESTNALAKAVGRDQGKKRKSRSVKLKEALQGCVTAFNNAHGTLQRLLDTTPAGPNRDRIAALLQPMEDLLVRAPAASTGADSAEPGSSSGETPDVQPAGGASPDVKPA